MNQPKPFSNHKDKIKAFVLGCDPTAFKKDEKYKLCGERKHLEFDVVFGIGGDDRYFAGILAKLELHRTLIPFYRHPAYSLAKNKEFADKLLSVFAD